MAREEVEVVHTCRICGNDLEDMLDFGQQPLANRLVTDPNEYEPKYHAVWGWCKKCLMLQLAESPKMEEMFTGDYPYRTDSSTAMVNHFQSTARELQSAFGLNAASLVVEIGANSGNFLEELTCQKFAYEPSLTCQRLLEVKRIPTTPAYFGEDSAEIATSYWGHPADLIYSANALRSIPGLDGILRGVALILRKGGHFVFEEPYLPDILRTNAADQFYDENVWCFTVQSVALLARKFGLSLESVRHLNTHGGSMRYILTNVNRNGDNSVDSFGAEEEGIYHHITRFSDKIGSIAEDLETELIALNGNVVGYGATAKSSTMLNYARIDSTLLPKIYDTTPAKWGKLTPGSHIPIVNADGFKDDPIEVALLFAWNHADEIIRRESQSRRGNWLVYVPEVRYL